MHAEFTGTCKNCEYRQLVRGYQRFKQPSGAWYEDPPQLSPGKFLDRTNYQEDGRLESSKWFRAGHRRDAPASASSSPTNFFHYASDAFTPSPRTTGCKYDSTDTVFYEVLKTQAMQVEVFLEFKGQIVAVDKDGKQVGDPVSEKTWTVQFLSPP